ncbi:uncharacterized protein LOC136079718 [Hydra vulgaris]|uniref:Uncharacterized protein LOC136079718 n=1 Tax=Hydra vulgaris TaxID=6087 RepID=A0ABM4BSA0_HYDVU
MAMQRVGRGRPIAPTTIVDEDEILAEPRVLQKNWCLKELGYSIKQPLSALKWLAKRGLIKNSMYCDTCQRQFGLNANQNATDDYQWYCKGCKQRRNVREGSLFSQTKLILQKLICYIYGWSRNMLQSDIQHKAFMNDASHTLGDSRNFCRDVCEIYLETNPTMIGGINAVGAPIVVEIDESKFFYRKYHCGQWRPGHWVYGGIERESCKCYLVKVPNRNAQTLKNLIEKFILPGSHIVSYGWASYAGLDNLQDGIYSHSVVVHERNFVNPLDSDVHTQNVENLWMRVKRKLRQQFGTRENLFTSHLHEFIWRQTFKEFPIFSAFLSCVSRQYPL